MVLGESIPLTELIDILRLFIVPAFGWAAYRDVKTRHITNDLWKLLLLLGVPLAVADFYLLYTRIGWSIGLLSPVISIVAVSAVGLVMWYIGGVGGADAKGIIVLSVMFPEPPVYFLPEAALPLVPPLHSSFALVILTNAIFIGLLFPLLVFARNIADGARGSISLACRRISSNSLMNRHGVIVENHPSARFGIPIVDLEILQQYVQWTEESFKTFREKHSGIKYVREGADGEAEEVTELVVEDPWQVDQFLAETDGPLYGATAEDLRKGLQILVAKDSVWYRPGFPFFIPLLGGVILAVTYGDIITGVIRLVSALI